MTRSQFLITLTVMLGVFMALVDMTNVNVALPTIAGNLGCSLDEPSLNSGALRQAQDDNGESSG